MQRCTPPVSMLWDVMSSFSTITSLSTPTTLCRCTLMVAESGKVRAGPVLVAVQTVQNKIDRDSFHVSPSGHANASFCPHAYGCRNVLVSENQIILDVTDHEVFLTVQIPADKTLWLVSVTALLVFLSLCLAYIGLSLSFVLCPTLSFAFVGVVSEF